MNFSIDKERWEKEFSYSDWYVRLKPEYEKISTLFHNANEQEQGIIKDTLYSYIEECLKMNKIYLAKDGPNLDVERKPIEKIVIHHTGSNKLLTKERISAIHLLRLYTGFHSRTDRKIGDPIWSNHFDDSGKQVFYSYHWLVDNNGGVERLLGDDKIGWHAGNWDINCRSVAICINANLNVTLPSVEMLKGVSTLIKDNYPGLVVNKENILGHCEVRSGTDCPGKDFVNGWKHTLLSML
jgi:N-acetyl-anhydromuramyl-L-alanine amidase AmpD